MRHRREAIVALVVVDRVERDGVHGEQELAGAGLGRGTGGDGELTRGTGGYNGGEVGGGDSGGGHGCWWCLLVVVDVDWTGNISVEESIELDLSVPMFRVG